MSCNAMVTVHSSCRKGLWLLTQSPRLTFVGMSLVPSLCNELHQKMSFEVWVNSISVLNLSTGRENFSPVVQHVLTLLGIGYVCCEN